MDTSDGSVVSSCSDIYQKPGLKRINQLRKTPLPPSVNLKKTNNGLISGKNRATSEL